MHETALKYISTYRNFKPKTRQELEDVLNTLRGLYKHASDDKRKEINEIAAFLKKGV